MYQGHRASALLLMAGEGSRFGGKIPKQFLLLNGIPLYAYALRTLIQTELFDEIVLVCHPQWIDQVHSEVRIVPGGATRQESSYLGLRALSPAPHLVLIHDAARPFVTHKMIVDNLEKALIYGAADTCTPATDTTVFSPDGTLIESIPQRSHVWRGQTPQTFLYRTILDAHEWANQMQYHNASDDCQLVLRMGKKVAIVPSSDTNLKITAKIDFTLAQALYQSQEV